jgi:hypothetical protein
LCRRNKMVPEVGDSTEKRHLQVIWTTIPVKTVK